MKTILILSILLSLGCGIFKRTTKDVVARSDHLKQQSVREQSEELKVNREDKVISVSRDSSKTDLKLRIWPKGPFSFSLVHGFSGVADSLDLEGAFLRTGVVSQDMLKKEKVLKQGALKTVALKEQEKKIREEHRVSVPSFNWLFYAGIVLVIWVCYRMGIFLSFGTYLKGIVRKLWH
ncbi:hypothetical protein [Pedobacter metabolipauper]|uniref:Lipoprotein n=1 Tax=Pedobacter metabolipauper TaxID=425513 RepID=A0A4R6SVV6_9SPHI|nr:hypothetical protein [Pedobacter metabolipauper]TDQ10038.1 hypothetical protein ATK78_2197 [Pedobacter metabolipauper]